MLDSGVTKLRILWAPPLGGSPIWIEKMKGLGFLEDEDVLMLGVVVGRVAVWERVVWC
jgi:hypothetical protein